MKILSIKIGSNFLFPDGFFIDFKNSDRVRKGSERHDNYKSAHKLKTGVYNQVLLSLVGLNATGKTTVLQIISFVANLAILQRSLESATYILNKLHVSKEKPLNIQVELLENNKVYYLDSLIVEDKGMFVFADETLYEIPLSQYKSNCEKGNFNVLKKRSDEINNIYLKSDESIIKSISLKKGVFIFNRDLVNFNYPRWLGEPPVEIIKLFDPSIKKLVIESSDDCSISSAKASIRFERSSESNENSVMSLENVVSSGTIKGLTIFPWLVAALSAGGYVVIDEIENHLNKKLITFIFDLFTDEKTNPKGACLIFSTHYPELLDYMTRKDNIYISLRDRGECLRVQRLSDSDKVTRNDILKSKILLLNIINGTAPKHSILKNAKDKVIDLLGSGE